MLNIIFKEIPDLPRLRVSSLDPAEIDHDFMDVLENQENLMPHFIEAAKAKATLGEMCDVLRGVFGEYREGSDF